MSQSRIHNPESNSEVTCDYCERNFSRKFNLQTHIEKLHMNSALTNCSICDQKFGSPSVLQSHLHRGHNRYGQPFPECDLCGRIFTRKQNVRSHITTAHSQGTEPLIRCGFCEKTFITDRNLRRHVKLLHQPGFECSICDYCKKTFKSKNSLITHIQEAHIVAQQVKIIKCACGKVFANIRYLKRHVELFHSGKPVFKCESCPKMYCTNQSLRRHARVTHSEDDENKFDLKTEKQIVDSHLSVDSDESSNDSNDIIICETCNKRFPEESVLRHHIKQEHSFDTFYEYCKNYLQGQHSKDCKSVFKCEFCFSAYHNVYELKDHMRVNHDTNYSLSTCNVCFSKFYSKETIREHRKICLPPPNVNSCSRCDKLFTDISSLEFHTRIFHPQAQIADSDITSTNDIDSNTFKCDLCERFYYSDRSLKHHVKLKHTADEAVKCEYCTKMFNNRYYLASHIKIVHNNVAVSKCDYCDKFFKTKRNIRRHIEYTHMGMQRHKCVECETLFKEKRSLRKHVRTKHPNSASFPQCHICRKRFESAKSCKIHLKLLHSFNMNTYPCDLCSVSFSSKEALKIHLESKHLAEDEIYKCEDCNLVFKGSHIFEQHNEKYHGSIHIEMTTKQKPVPRCIICVKDFSTRKTLKRHLKKFHAEFKVDELTDIDYGKNVLNVECEDCIKNFTDEYYLSVYNKLKHARDSIIFKCETCKYSYDSLEFAIQRHKSVNSDVTKSKMILSELCTTEMSDDDDEVRHSGFGSLHEYMEAESTTADIKVEPQDTAISIVKIEESSIY